MNQARPIFIVFLFLISLTGCTIIPGSHIDGANPVMGFAEINEDVKKVNLVVIDAELINRLSSDNMAQAVQDQHSELYSQPSDYSYKLGVGDVLTIGVWDHPELTIPAAVQRTAEFDGFRVQEDGTITYAYSPNIQAAGKTVVEVREALSASLRRVIEDPQIDIKIVGYRSQKAFITGEVNRPKTIAIDEVPLTLVDAINESGGLTEFANWRSVSITRNSKQYELDLHQILSGEANGRNIILQDGDIVHVNRNDSSKVFMLGELRTTGPIRLSRYGMTLAEALTEMGGINQDTANGNGVFVLRTRSQEDDFVADVYQLHASDVAAMVLADQFTLQARDIVYVTSAPVARWNRVIRLLLPTATTINQARN